MADALVTQLARALHLPPDAAQQTLHHLVSTLREQIEADGEAAVPGLGIFRQTDDRLDFEPEEALVRAVNHRYAGLSALGAVPVERTPQPPEPPAEARAGFKPLPSFIEEELQPRSESQAEPSPEAEPDKLSEDELIALLESQETLRDDEDADVEDALPEEEPTPAPEAFEPDQAELEQGEPNETELEEDAVPTLAPTLPDDPVPITPDEPASDAPSDLDELLAGTWTEETDTSADAAHPLGPLPPSPLEEADYSLVEPDPADEGVRPADPHAEDDEPTVAAPAVTPLDPEYAGAPTSEEPPAAGPPAEGPVIAAPAVAALGAKASAPSPKRPSRMPLYAGIAVGTVLALAFLLWTRSRTPEPPPVAVRPPAADTVATVPPPADLADADTTAAPVAPVEPPVSADPLRSTGGIDPAEGGVTWVVASELSQAAAERQAERYRAKGLRAGVVAEQAAGRTRYRVSLGQFESVEAAEARRADLPADVPSDSWILRL